MNEAEYERWCETIRAGATRAREVADRRGYKLHPRLAARPVTSFFASLTPEQRAAALAHDGPDEHGDPAFLRRAEKDYGI